MVTAIEYARKNGFLSAKKMIPWNGYACYEAIYSDESVDNTPATGIPQIILKSRDAMRMATYDETMSYMDYVLREKDARH